MNRDTGSLSGDYVYTEALIIPNKAKLLKKVKATRVAYLAASPKDVNYEELRQAFANSVRTYRKRYEERKIEGNFRAKRLWKLRKIKTFVNK